MMTELLFAQGCHPCAVCVADGRCELQDLAVQVGMDHVRVNSRCTGDTVDASHARFLLDRSRCVLCTRCVRVCAEIEGAPVWEIAGRGTASSLVAEGGVPWGAATSCTSCVASASRRVPPARWWPRAAASGSGAPTRI